jgi:hypothetical protein
VAGVETGLPCRHYVLPHHTTLVVVVALYVHVNVKVKRMPGMYCWHYTLTNRQVCFTRPFRKQRGAMVSRWERVRLIFNQAQSSVSDV